MMPLTERQRAILALLWRERCEGRPIPSVPELCAALGLRTTSTVYHHIMVLCRKGLLDWQDRRSRTFRLTEAGHLALGRRTRFTVQGSVS